MLTVCMDHTGELWVTDGVGAWILDTYTREWEAADGGWDAICDRLAFDFADLPAGLGLPEGVSTEDTTTHLMPLLGRERYTVREWVAVGLGLCDWVIDSDRRTVSCLQPSDPGSPYRYCAEHDAQAAENDPDSYQLDLEEASC